MKIQLVTPAPLKLNNGNKITALRWIKIFQRLGHRVRLTRRYDGAPCDLLIALHARRSAESIRRFREKHSQLPLIVVLTGTDVYRDIHRDAKAKASLEHATRLVLLQNMALDEIPRRLRRKTKVIYQSAAPLVRRRRPDDGVFDVCVIGHLRAEKDPLRAAMTARDLPKTSRLRITHIGQALDPILGKRARREATRNRRYRWLGPLSHKKTREYLAQSDLLCITSTMEGSSNVLSEALASGVPVVATKISGLIGTLGAKFPGYFPVGNTRKLRALLLKAESDAKFYRSLEKHSERLARRVDPATEIEAWRRLLNRLN
jgi:putative glycosyltransferase (TIGR04348 family)